MSWGHAVELEQQLKEEVARLLAMAAIAEAKAKLEQRAGERHAAEQAEYEAKKEKREAAREAGKTPKGTEPKAPEAGVRDSDQINLTDEESRIMPGSGGKNFQQAYNVQAGVDTETMLVVTAHVTQHANDKLEVEPTLKALEQLPETLGKVEAVLADTGYRSESNTKLCHAANTTPYLAGGRESHHPPVEQRFIEPAPLPGSCRGIEATVSWIYLFLQSMY